MACVTSACNQATGINSIIGYNLPNILLPERPSQMFRPIGATFFSPAVNFLAVTIGGVMLRRAAKGRKSSAVTIGTAVDHRFAGLHRPALRVRPNDLRVDSRTTVQSMVKSDQR